MCGIMIRLNTFGGKVFHLKNYMSDSTTRKQKFAHNKWPASKWKIYVMLLYLPGLSVINDVSLKMKIKCTLSNV